MLSFRFLSRWPLWLLYGLANLLYFLLAYVIRYRKLVIKTNLQQSFPTKSPAEIQSLVKGFYRNLTDLIVETIKLPTLSADELRRRVVFTNSEVATDWIRQGQTIIIMASHQANWEWLPAAAVLNGIPADSIYKPLSSPFFEKLMHEVRSTHGPKPVPMHQIPRELARRRHETRAIALVADQIPDAPEFAYWTTFLHQDTPFYPGTERLARSQKLPVVYIQLKRLKRGYYEGTFATVAEPPYDQLPQGAILERYRDLLESTIEHHPADWLWSHKRWKHHRGEYVKLEVKLE